VGYLSRGSTFRDLPILLPTKGRVAEQPRLVCRPPLRFCAERNLGPAAVTKKAYYFNGQCRHQQKAKDRKRPRFPGPAAADLKMKMNRPVRPRKENKTLGKVVPSDGRVRIHPRWNRGRTPVAFGPPGWGENHEADERKGSGSKPRLPSR